MGLLLQLMNQQFDAKNEFTISKFTYNGQDYGPQCYLQDESMIPKASELTCTREPFVFAPIDYMYEDLDGLLPLFGRDVDFRNLVMKTFEVIFRPENVLAVTYNPIFGKLWRLCCRQRLDPRLDDLTTKLSQCVPQMDGNAKQQVSDWLEESYNDSPRIQDAIAQVPSVQSCFILDSVSLTGVTSADLRSLARSPTPDVLRKVTNLLTHVQRIDSVGYNDDDGVPLYLPEALSNDDLFSFLPHLLHRGTTFSRRGAALLAMICCFSNHAWLAPRADAYLKSIRGTWLTLDYAAEFPELFSAEFINIVHRGLEYLTPDEQFVYRQLFAVNRMRLAATKKVDLTTGFAPKKTSGLWPDRKARCHTCGYDTSLSLMVSPVLCAMCFTYGDDAPRLQAETSIAGNQSHMVECTDCHGLYAILQLKQLGTHPKCWYCRSKAPERPLMASCSNCRNHYIDPAGLYNMTLCPVCTDAPSRGTTSHSVKFFDLLDENRTLAVAFGWTMDVFKDNFVNLVFDKRLSLFKWFTSQDKALLLSGRPSTDQDDDEDVVVPLHHQGKIVHDTRNLCKNLQTVVLHDALRDTCLMCYDEYALDKLDSPCGRSCTAKVCDRCMKRWYRAIQPGKLIRWANLSCPFCRQAPKVGVLRKYNRDICALQRNDLTTMRADAYYGWCLSCFQVKPMGQRNCMTEPPHDVTDFHCEGCVNATQVHTIPCPKCQVLTEKIGGCNHMTCSNCNQHWCFECSAGFDSDDEVYEHLYAVHGGVGV
ncbi:unnamed protein product [Aphanomyces euteiches]